MPVKRILCLANSRKLAGRCIAGKEVDGARGWVRPVSAREHEEVSEHERQYEDGSDPRLLDIIDVPLLEPRARTYQSENWLLDPNSYWVRLGRASWDEAAAHCEAPGALWINGHSTYAGLNDRVPLQLANQLASSLRLVATEQVRLHVFAPGGQFGNPKRRVQARFAHAGGEYHLWVTDPHIEREYLRRPDGAHDLGAALVTVSLGEPHDGFAYKLVAAVIVRPIQGGRT
jgi:hypothetical protein